MVWINAATRAVYWPGSIKTIKLTGYLLWKMDETCHFGQKEFLIQSHFEKQGLKKGKNKGMTTTQTQLFWVLLLLLPNTRNSCLNFPLSCVSIVLRQGGNWPLRACGDCCFLHSFSCERQQSSLYYKGLFELCTAQLLRGKEWEGPRWYFVVAIKLSYCSRYHIEKKNDISQENKLTNTHTHTKSLIQI